MSTTRHLLNRQRRRQAVGSQPVPAARAFGDTGTEEAPGSASRPPGGSPRAPASPRTRTRTRAGEAEGARKAAGSKRNEPPERDEGAGAAGTRRGGGKHLAPLLILCALTVVLGAFAGFAQSRAAALRDDPVRGNTALTDLARTSEIKGQAAKAVASLFSYDHAKPAAFESASKTSLTGKAVTQHRALFGDVLAQAGKQKTVITTTVTDSAVERIDGDRARVLIYADQSSVGTAGTEKQTPQDQGVYAGAMLALDLVARDGRWLVEGIDTFGR
ncbi:hypothetical protein [Streptomyces antarcticus]|uniref:hypothetical protein n=1 Tax=Streptomyces antarcticus TaxID=2996458 RepID=UPI002271587E|nr:MULTISPECIES: hypothetical protein [unclassified Streptomyces]MCY0946197.1 hypothetical protein [Streptomyces sp. H34-AA3]MCZ4084623.1 hypothetical protein [Streptomyces sp. H34-S5]